MVSRRKEGFLMPVARWMRCDLESWVRETLAPARLQRHGVFDATRVQDLIDAFYRTEDDYRTANKVLALVVFQEWHEMYMP
jgi:asparagine synthase (glutamine-hydrolysing)